MLPSGSVCDSPGLACIAMCVSIGITERIEGSSSIRLSESVSSARRLSRAISRGISDSPHAAARSLVSVVRRKSSNGRIVSDGFSDTRRSVIDVRNRSVDAGSEFAKRALRESVRVFRLGRAAGSHAGTWDRRFASSARCWRRVRCLIWGGMVSRRFSERERRVSVDERAVIGKAGSDGQAQMRFASRSRRVRHVRQPSAGGTSVRRLCRTERMVREARAARPTGSVCRLNDRDWCPFALYVFTCTQ
mmetsp:Transcript_7848/g.17365  ORF Transcript_7848/g.17365 Transcript_7848/m.17365 type:complete len:247 (-) Transcript_7848:94-834(-)